MPIPIIIAILVALFTLGTQINQPAADKAAVVIAVGEKQDPAVKKDNRDNLVQVAAGEQEQAAGKEQEQTEDFENVFQLWSLYKIVSTNP